MQFLELFIDLKMLVGENHQQLLLLITVRKHFAESLKSINFSCRNRKTKTRYKSRITLKRVISDSTVVESAILSVKRN